MTQPELLTIARDGLPARSTGQWVHDKKYYLDRFLSIFTRGVGPKWNGKLCYIDLFSGPGRSVIRDTGEEIEGSPLSALNYEFAQYVFVDVPQVIDSLQQRLEGNPKSKKVSLVQGDCNEVIEAVRACALPDHLTLAFVDPTGLQIRFQTLRRLVQDRKVDLLMTIQFGMGMRMNLRQYFQSESNALTDFMGNETWREDVESGGSASQICHRILDRYIRQLKELGYETVQNREIPVRTDQNNLLLYFIVLASRHPRGHDFWRKATQIQPSGQRLLNL
jgi:three-Cys-motif partner protein